jgi:hypothetical protein
MSRRDLLRATGCGFGYLAFAAMATEAARAAGDAYQSPLAPKKPHFKPRAKRVIFLFMQGGPSQIDMFDHKPALEKLAGKTVEFSGEGQQFKQKLRPSDWRFERDPKTGFLFSELIPHLSGVSEDLCILRGMHTDSSSHTPAAFMLHTGAMNVVRPSTGSWIVYGLGTENENLPAFVTINPVKALGGAQNYAASFLPACYQGTRFLGAGEVMPHIKNASISDVRQRRFLDLLQARNQAHVGRSGVNPDVEGLIHSYELAYRMQAAVPDVMDCSRESAATKRLYGVDDAYLHLFPAQCLRARRLAEAGVRFIQVTNQGWDTHFKQREDLPKRCKDVDQPIAALITDLKQRGMLDDTLVVWGGEFGRTPAEENSGDGRMHQATGYTMFLAGGGVKGGMLYGKTDETGSRAVEGKMHVHDLHATILHLLGLDHERLVYRHAGRDFRLTDVYGRVPEQILA